MCLPPPDLPLRDSSYASRPVSCTCLPRYVSSPAVHLVSHGIPHLLRYNSSSAHPASGLALYRHPTTSHNIMRPTMTSRNSRGTSHLPLAFCSRPGCPAAPCEIHDATTSSGPSHYPPTSLPSDPTRPALPHASRIPLPTCTRSRSRPAAARLPRLLCSVSLHARLPLLGFSLFPFMFCT